MQDLINKLDDKAYALYEANATDQDFIKNFTRDELIKLWYNKCTYKFNKDGALLNGASYDDEVYDALETLEFWA